jgi:hypothetical protein
MRDLGRALALASLKWGGQGQCQIQKYYFTGLVRHQNKSFTGFVRHQNKCLTLWQVSISQNNMALMCADDVI